MEIDDTGLQDRVDVLADSDYECPSGHPLRLRLTGYGYRWLRRKQHLFG